MKISFNKKIWKSRAVKYLALCGIFLAIVLVIYVVTGESMTTYYYEDDSNMELISATPSDIDGVSRDTTIVLQWNHPISPDLADAVTIHPSARGEWFVSGNYLIFTPQQLAAGEYYTVSIPKGTVLNEQGDTLQKTIFFAFETENTDLRVPDTEAFDVDGRAFSFSDEESVSIPVSVMNDDETIDAAVYLADDGEAFTDTFAPLFKYPSWARLSIDSYEGELKGFDKVIETTMGVRNENGKTFVDLGSLPKGQYLVRLSSGKDQRDVAVTVSSVDMGIISENDSLVLWSHKDGKPNGEAEIFFGEKSYTLDENGYAAIPCNLTEAFVYRNPDSLVLTFEDDGNDFVYFLSADDLEDSYQTDMVLSKKNILNGDSMLVSGSVFTETGGPLNGKADLSICTSTGTVLEKEIRIENGYFTEQWDDLYLTKGSYRVVLRYDGVVLEVRSFTAGEETYELILTVEKSDDVIRSGDSVEYRAKVCDKKGRPVTYAEVFLNADTSVRVDKNGEAVFRKTYHAPEGVTSVQKDAGFHVVSEYGDAADVVSSVSVISLRQNRMESSKNVVASVEKEELALIHGEESIELIDEEQSPTLKMTYLDGNYDVVVVSDSITLDVPNSVDTGLGEKISVSADLGDGSYRIAAVSLCAGRVPDGLRNKLILEESFGEHTFGVLEETRVFFGGEPIDAVFSPENRDGDYYIRVAVKIMDNAVYVRYIPVTVQGVKVFCPEYQSIASSYNGILSFGTNTAESFDYTLTVDDKVFTGTTRERFTVSLDGLSSGRYHGEIVITEADTVLASKAFVFEVYDRMPMFTDVVEGSSENAVFACQVKEGKEDHFMSAYDIISLPGDQILLRMGRTLFYDALGESVGGDFSDLNYDLSDLQNGDGSFGRYFGAQGDILLSVFVAEREEFVCDRASLCAYLKYRLITADSTENAALACWGLSCFGVDCSDSMSLLYNGKGITDRTLLYLAEGYEAAGNIVYAENIYEELSDDLVENDGKLHLPDPDDQYNIANTAFMLDLALKLNHSESEGLMKFLMEADIQNQSGRYLLLSSILRVVNGNQIAPLYGNSPRNGFEVISIVPSELSEVPVLSTSYSFKGEVVSSAKQNDIVDLTLFWEASSNSIYLVYIDEGNSTSVIEKNGVKKRNGYFEFVTNVGSATISFKANTVGEHSTPTAYIIDLTAGVIVGRSDDNGLKVSK